MYVFLVRGALSFGTWHVLAEARRDNRQIVNTALDLIHTFTAGQSLNRVKRYYRTSCYLPAIAKQSSSNSVHAHSFYTAFSSAAESADNAHFSSERLQ